MASKKKTSKKTTAKKSTNLPAGNDIPEGFQRTGSSFAPTWNPEDVGTSLRGVVTAAVHDVEMKPKRGQKQGDIRRCMEVTENNTATRYTVWESAMLGELFDKCAEAGEGAEVFIRYDGLGKKKPGQNAPKLYTAAIAA